MPNEKSNPSGKAPKPKISTKGTTVRAGLQRAKNRGGNKK
jgi:hypothetical protein